MNRKEFLASAIAAGAAACATGLALPVLAMAEPADAVISSRGFRAKRRIFQYSGDISAPPEAVFPLLCPVREYEWIDGWTSQVIFSDSGVAEENCIFKSGFLDMIWNVCRYEPPQRIEFSAVAPDKIVLRLNLYVERLPTGTRLHWTRIFTGLSPAGNDIIDALPTHQERGLTQMLEYYLKTGKMLRAAGK